MRRRHLLSTTLALAPALLAAPRVARAAARRLKLGHNNTPDSVIHVAAAALAESVAAASGGQLTVEIFPNSVLGTEAQMTTAVADGSLDMGVLPNGAVSGLAKEVGLNEIPYLFPNVAQARAKLDGALGQHCTELLGAKEVRVLAWSEVGLRHFTANKPVATPADLRGLKLRVPLSPAILESFRAMGAAADGLPFPQLAEALRTGRFEAQENPINIIVSNSLQRFQSHLTLTGHVYTPAAIVISGDAWGELDGAAQAMLVAGAKRGAAAARAFADQQESAGVETLRAAGMKIVTEVDRAGFQRAAQAAQVQLGAFYGADAVARMQKLAA